MFDAVRAATSNMRQEAAAVVANLASRAQELGDETHAPTVTIETDSKNIFIHKKDGVSLAVYRVRCACVVGGASSVAVCQCAAAPAAPAAPAFAQLP